MADTTRAVGRPKGVRVAFTDIVEHSLSAEIDRKLFHEGQDVQSVFNWLKEQDPEYKGSYSQMWRYYRSKNSLVLNDVVARTSRTAMSRNYDTLDRMIASWKQSVEQGARVGAKDAIAAMRLQIEIIERYGGSPFQVEEEAKQRLRLLVEIVSELMDNSQKERFIERIQGTPELIDWLVTDE